MKENVYEDNLKDQLQAYYGNEILDDSSIWVNGVEDFSESINYLNNKAIKNKDVGNSKSGIEQLNEYDCDFCESEDDELGDGVDIEKVFIELIETKSLKELLTLYNNLSKKIKKEEHKMQNLIYNNYSKLKYLSKFFKSINSEVNISNLLESFELNTDSTQYENDFQDYNTTEMVDLNKVESLRKLLKSIKENILNDDNSKNLNEYLNYRNFITAVFNLKKFDAILNSYYSSNNYREIIVLYNKWNKALEFLSNDMEVFKQIYLESNKIFEKTIDTLKCLLVIKNNTDIKDNIDCVLKVYNSLCNEKHYFTDEIVNNVNEYLQNKTNELIINQLNELDNLDKINQFKFFKDACMHVSNSIFYPLKYIVKELISSNDKEDVKNIIERIVEYFFDNSGNKLVNFLNHLLVYNEIELDINDEFKNVIDGIDYLREFFSDFNSILDIYGDDQDEIEEKGCNFKGVKFARIYREWCKRMLNMLFSIDKINTKICYIWENLFDDMVDSMSKIKSDNSLMNLFTIFNKNVIDSCINYDIFNFIVKYHGLNVIDYDSCENLVRRNIKNYFQLIISDSNECVNNVYFSEINSEYLTCIHNYSKLEDFISVELISYNKGEKNSLNSQAEGVNIECNNLSEKLLVTDYRTKMKFFILVILTIRYLRKYTLISSISLFYKYFYDKNYVDNNNSSNIQIYDLFNSNNNVEYNLSNIDFKNKTMNDTLISEIREDVSIKVIEIIYKRFELLYLNIFVIWNVNAIIKQTMESVDNYIGFDEFIDIISAKVSLLTNTLCELDKCQNNISSKNMLIKDFRFPLEDHEKSVIYGKWCKNYRILTDFDLNNIKHLNNEFSFWTSQIINGVLIEIISILKKNSVFRKKNNGDKILIEIICSDNNSNIDLDFISTERTSDNKESSIKSLVWFWEKTSKGFVRYSKEFNITYSLFCEIYNIIMNEIESINKQ
ncbi:hypothetical protein FG386_000615 [Cryptosporidium ryanae]|uniref:uncharacterized protein n=1 Tax=Cryptosporidium ryanae TaxID=515981 RepID=UPI00351A07DD|nr:hypothetical protein FG386_000615 [Cryptosporidium ryanae]